MSGLAWEGMRVMDVSAVLAAPVTSTFLGDFGSEVVKVEEPGVGDFTRGRARMAGGRSLGPRPGQHNEEIFGGPLGPEAEAIESFAAQGIG